MNVTSEFKVPSLSALIESSFRVRRNICVNLRACEWAMTWRRFTHVFCMFLLISVPAHGAERVALVIGNGAYMRVAMIETSITLIYAACGGLRIVVSCWPISSERRARTRLIVCDERRIVFDA